MNKQLISIVIPAYNESGNIEYIYTSIMKVFLEIKNPYEVVFVNDGSTDNTSQKIVNLAKVHKNIRLVDFSRNFGKEIATTAGIHYATGDAIIILDADGQHPVKLIPDFIELWNKGNKVVVGVRKNSAKDNLLKKQGSRLFYKIFNKFSGVTLVPGSTDFRLIDKEVQEAFNKLNEQDRITRGLIDWLGYKREYIYFSALDRHNGEATYTPKKLILLAMNSFVSLSFAPLFLFGYIGIIITILSFVCGLFVLVEQYVLSDPMSLNITGTASLGILILFAVGILLVSQGMISVYISKIYAESKRRPLFLIDRSRSIL
jgi:glycosyltransferase involved in cell wall biosynthesis